MSEKFSIEHLKNTIGFNEINIVNKISGEIISVLPELGARINSAKLLANGKLISVIKELKSSRLKSNDELFNNAKLFPFAGRINKGVYNFRDQTFHLPINYVDENNACHGFVYDKKFEIISEFENEDFAEVELMYNNNGDYTGYPFKFKLNVRIALNYKGEVIVYNEVENLSSTTMPFSDGWHPYYTFENNIDDMIIEFNPNEKIELDRVKIPNGNKIHFNLNDHQKIDLKNKNLDDVFKFLPMSDIHELKIISKITGSELLLWQEAGINKYNYLVIYTPPDRKSIAVEPVTSNIDSFNNKEDLIIIDAGNKWNASYGFKIFNNQK